MTGYFTGYMRYFADDRRTEENDDKTYDLPSYLFSQRIYVINIYMLFIWRCANESEAVKAYDLNHINIRIWNMNLLIRSKDLYHKYFYKGEKK